MDNHSKAKVLLCTLGMVILVLGIAVAGIFTSGTVRKSLGITKIMACLQGDTIAPKLEVQDLQVMLGERPDYMAHVTCSNNSGKYKLSVDTSQVNLNKGGCYPVVYVAADSLHNETRKTVTLRVVDPDQKIIYLTFDDGPSENTSKILDILRAEGVKATFFVTAQFAKYVPLMAQEAREGHVVAPHSYYHNFSIYRSFDTFFDDLEKIEQVIEKYTGKRSPMIRFPGGSSNHIYRRYHRGDYGFMKRLKAEVIKRGYQYVDWNLDSEDASGGCVPAARLISSACHTYHPQMCLLMHDTAGKKTTPEALPEIIRYFKQQGYEFGVLNDTSLVCHHGESKVKLF